MTTSTDTFISMPNVSDKVTVSAHADPAVREHREARVFVVFKVLMMVLIIESSCAFIISPVNLHPNFRYFFTAVAPKDNINNYT